MNRRSALMDAPDDAEMRDLRSDALPEEHEYRDEGCDAAPSCLACPFVECRYDGAGGIRAIRNRTRNPEIARLLKQGLTGQEVSARMGVSLRTVWRASAATR